MKFFKLFNGLGESKKVKTASGLFFKVNDFSFKKITDNADRREALIQNGKQQFKRLKELGLQLPIAVL